MIVEMLQDEHRRYIALPSPDELEAELDHFRPSGYDWRKRRTWQSRSKRPRRSGQRSWRCGSRSGRPWSVGRRDDGRPRRVVSGPSRLGRRLAPYTR